MTGSSKPKPPPSPPYIPSTLEEKEEAFRLAAQLMREFKKDLKRNPPK